MIEVTPATFTKMIFLITTYFLQIGFNMYSGNIFSAEMILLAAGASAGAGAVAGFIEARIQKKSGTEIFKNTVSVAAKSGLCACAYALIIETLSPLILLPFATVVCEELANETESF